MKNTVPYKNCLIRCESFQWAESSGWVPRYALMCPAVGSRRSGMRAFHDRLDEVFGTEHEADKFALQDAMRWINENLQGRG